MRRSPLRRPLPRSDVSLSLSQNRSCPRDTNCACRSMKQRSTPLGMCPNPECREVEQMKMLQNSLDHFTDYDHYVRCCDGHMHGTRAKDDRCVAIDIKHLEPTDICVEYFNDCDECAEKHADCYDEVDICDDDCEQCEEECEEQGHEPEDCPHDHPTTRDNCAPPCDQEEATLPQLGPTDDFDLNAMSGIVQGTTPCTDDCSMLAPPVPASSHGFPLGMMFDNDMDHWQTFVQAHHCAPDPCMIGQPPQFQHPQHMDPSFGFTFGCDPTIPANQYPWQRQTSPCNVPLMYQTSQTGKIDILQQPLTQRALPIMSKSPISSQSSATDAVPPSDNNPTGRICEWVMPCGSICGAAFPRTEELKKHIKNSHSTKGTVTCRWQFCSASFATEAALTGHISKKHLTVSDEEGPWKCTFPGCIKSFMYKQVRDDHLASHNGGNRMHCPICHQWLNCEGSNFRRHMASHGPKNEYRRCRYETLGCKKRFPRLDNLRRHEACCKFGKKAAGIHHHHHRIHVDRDK